MTLVNSKWDSNYILHLTIKQIGHGYCAYCRTPDHDLYAVDFDSSVCVYTRTLACEDCMFRVKKLFHGLARDIHRSLRNGMVMLKYLDPPNVVDDVDGVVLDNE